MSEEGCTITIAEEHCQRIAQRMKGTEFKSIEEYVNYVLSELLASLEEEEEEEEAFTEEDEEAVKERLRALGYLD